MTVLKRLRVVALGEPKFIDREYLKQFKEEFDYSYLPASNRQEAKQLLAKDVTENGKIDALIIRMGTAPYLPFDKDLLGALVPGTRIISSAKAGYDEFDVSWMTEHGCWFCNTRDSVSEATADMAMLLILAVLKNLVNAERSLRSGTWRADLVPTRDPSGLTLGIIGMGAIGKHLARKAMAFNMKIAYHNRTRLPAEVEAEYKATYYSSLKELLSASDVISMNCPYSPQTEKLIGVEEFKAMKEGAYFINTARGPTVDEEALIQALESGKVTRAGLDVFTDEPRVKPYFLESDKVIVQPHLGGLTDVAFQKAEMECFENIRQWARTGVPNSGVVDLAQRN
ncbi:hypothetical protein KEM55_002680 [Ascosphaera atra]|nr:hypothetical protein KEM55_002680 [Ascosphaera atra]